MAICNDKLIIYAAHLENLPAINRLIAQSARVLQTQYYKKSAIETALELVSSIEPLIAAESFYVVEYEDQIIGCGGWSIADIKLQTAEIRGFFVHPNFARQGIATRLFSICEYECQRKGVTVLYLTATLSGEPFYRKHGFSELNRFKQKLSNNEMFELVNMEKQLSCFSL